MLRKLGLCVAIASSLLVSKVNALGLGEITVQSALNEPLRAEIRLFQVKGLSPLQIKSRMADLNDFALSGLATQRALSDVRFQVRVRANGTGRIILSSKLPVTEPFMNFLVEVNWPSGRLVREYTLLLDPPADQSVVNNRNYNNPRISNGAVVEAPKPQPTQKKAAPAPKPVAKPKESSRKAGQYYIGPKDTLWDIAIENRPSSKVTPQQMMVLIQRKNPQAFPNANINVMTAKRTIDLPTQAEIDALTPKAAQEEVTRQTALWRSGKLPAVVDQQQTSEAKSSAQTAKTAPKTPADKVEPKAKAPQEMAKADKPMLKDDASMDANSDAAIKAMSTEKGMVDVVNSEEAKQNRELKAKAEAMALAASKDSEKIADLLKNNAELDVKLALSQESIDKLERDNKELNDKLDTIIKQLEDMNRLSLLKDEQLAALEDERLQELKEREDQAKMESEKSWLDKFLENTMGLVAAGVGWLLAVVAGVFLLLRRKKKPEEDDVAEEKSEPAISLPDEMLEEDLQSLEELEEPATEASAADGVDDLDLDLDLDMDMDLEESLNGAADDLDDLGDNDDLAAELEAELDEEDDDLDMLDGIDSLEFDLGESEEDENQELVEVAEAVDEEDAEAQALAEFAAAMDETAPEADEPAVDEDEEAKALAEFEAAMEETAPEEETDEDEEAKALAEFATAMEETAPEDAADEASENEQPDGDLIEQEPEIEAEDLEIELPAEDEVDPDSEISVEEDEVDITDIADSVTSIDELEAQEDLEEAALEVAEPDVSEDLTASEEADAESIAEDAVEELVEEDQDLLEREEPQNEEPDSDPLDEMFENLEPQETPEEEMPDLEIELVEDDFDENSLDGALDEAASDEEVDEQLPMDDALESLLEVDEGPDDTESLSNQVDELLTSTDDDIAFEEIAPAFDTDNEDDIDLLSGEDGLRMKLDLARAYVEMGDSQGAKDIISEVIDGGDAEQRKEAQQLLDSLT